MAYQRFRLEDCPATVATPATLQDQTAQTIAKVANVAGHTEEIPGSIPKSVATVARSCTETEFAIPTESAGDIFIALERIEAELRSKGHQPKHVHARARALVRADLRNSLLLFIRQSDPSRCHVCGERESPDLPFIAVLSAAQDRPHWLHVACHAEHGRRINARIDAIFCNVDLLRQQPWASAPDTRELNERF